MPSLVWMGLPPQSSSPPKGAAVQKGGGVADGYATAIAAMEQLVFCGFSELSSEQKVPIIALTSVHSFLFM